MAGKAKTQRKALGRSPLAQDVDLPLAPIPAKVERRPMQISHYMLARAAERPNYSAPRFDGNDLFRPYEPAPGVLPEGRTAEMAMDDAGISALGWAGGFAGGYIQSAAYKEGQTFLGYSELALMLQRPEYRIMCETLADEATRKWIKFRAASEDESKSDKISAIEEEFKRLKVRENFRIAAEKDAGFGRHHLYLDTGDTEDPQELTTNLGDSRSVISKGKVSPDRPLRALRSIEAMWVYPSIFNSTNPLKKDWYRPSVWYVMGRQIHASRLLTFVAREVPDILKSAYAFGGLALTQMAKPYVDNWLITRQSVQDLIKGFSTFVLKTDMQAAYSGAGGDDFFNRADMFNLMRNNRGLMMLDKENEDFANVSAPLSGLDHLQAQALEHICIQRGTLIETRRGQVPVEDVTNNDFVLTRQGFAPVKWAGITGKASRFTEIKTSRSVLRATECHPIWSDTIKEFVNAKNVDLSHCLLESRSWASTECRSFGGVDIGEKPRPAIIGTLGVAASFIASYGKRIAAQFQKVLIFITGMKMEPTIPGIISSLSPVPSTCGSIGSVSINRLSISDSARPATSYLNPAKSVQNIARTIARPNTTKSNADGFLSRPTLKSVSNAALNMKARCEIEAGSAQALASSVNVTSVSTRLLREQEVYNLEVGEGHLPEFFANGVLIHNCSVIQEPLVKYTGISPSGLNASSEGELLCWKDKVHSYQEAFFRPHLETVLNFVQLSLWGEIDDDIVFDFLPIHELTEKEQAELEQLRAQTDGALVEIGVIDAHEVRGRIASDETSLYAGLDVDDMPEAPGGEMMPGMEGVEDLGGEGAGEAGHEHAGHAAELAPSVHPALALKPPHKSLGIGGMGNSKSEGGFKPAGDAELDVEPKTQPKPPKRTRNLKLMPDPPPGSVEANAGEKL